MLALVLPVFFSCRKDEWPQDYTDEERALMDRLVGEYVLEDVIWEGVEVDLDGDGAAETDFYSLFNSHEFGFADDMNLVARHLKGYGYPVSIDIGLTLFDRSSDHWWQTSFYAYASITGGVYEAREIGGRFGDREMTLTDMTLEPSGGDLFCFSGDTVVHDRLTDSFVPGRITWIFRCTSGKGKNDLKQ